MARFNSLLLASLLFASAACTGGTAEEVDTQGALVPTIVITDLPAVDTPVSFDGSFNTDSLDFIASAELDVEVTEEYSSICECTNQECQDEWVEETFGCGICLFVQDCGDGVRRGACVACE
jgi:hypothetical protein